MRCVNIDWLEVSCEESVRNFPCNAEYYIEKGYFVKERDFGTRVWSQVFTLEDEHGHPWIEIRRCPPSGASSFTGLSEYSCRLRLVNAQCYVTDCIERLRQFILKHGYIFKKIFRIDVCYDFEMFDYGDQPARFARRYVQGRYRKVNQAHLSAHGMDNWGKFNWESLSWGSPTSMVSTKMYNKSLEIATVSREKTYIPLAWFQCGLIDDPINQTKMTSKGEIYKPDIWRVEFSLKSKAERWLVIEAIDGKRTKKKAVPHTLSLFDSPDKLWQRFQDLAYHYFRFKIGRFKEESKSLASLALGETADKAEWEPIRKDLCPEKKLFKWDKDHEFLHIDNCVDARKPDNDLEVLRRRLTIFRNTHSDMVLREACAHLLEYIETEDLRRYTPKQMFSEVEALRRTLALRMKHPDVKIVETISEIEQLLFNEEMF